MLRVTKAPHADGDAVSVVEEVGMPPWTADADLQVVGQPLPRVEGAAKVTGAACYTADVHLPGMLVARVLRSPYPHAYVLRVESGRAAVLPGVRAVLSSENAPAIAWYQDSALFDRTVRFVGDEVAAVAADTEAIAEEALRLIAVDYAPLPFVLDPEHALTPDAPRLREGGNVLGQPKVYQRGDVEAGLRRADVVIDQIYTTQAAVHHALEPHGCVAWWVDGHLTLWESTQGIFAVRSQVAQALGLPEHAVRVIARHVGGGFGAKQIAWKHAVIAALLSKQTGRPVRLMLDREAESLAVGHRNATRQRVRLGATRDGVLTAIDARIVQNVGAYLVGGEGSDVSGAYSRLYRCANVRTEQIAVCTNTGPAVAFRAPGYVEGMFALESAMDELARALGIDPLELRLRNYTGDDQVKDMPYSAPEGLRRCYERAAEVFGWRTYRKPAPVGARRRGIGLAAHDWAGGGWPPGYAWVKLDTDGTAEVHTATQDIGTGTRTGLTVIAAEELGLAPERVRLELGDTGAGPYAPTSAGSATQATIGPAVRAAAAEARRQLLEAAAPLLDADPGRLRLRDGQVEVDGHPGRRIAIGEVTRRIAPYMIQGFGARAPNPADRSVRTFGVQCVEVEVDVETGEVRVLRLVAAHDCGRVINPMTVDSQVIGGVVQGLGFALSEERIVDQASGVVLNANLEEYLVPTVADAPPIVHAQVNLADAVANATAAKGVGEPPIVPTAPAVANAVFDAVGVRIRDLPLTRRRLLAAFTGGQ